jgi:hypothetical protein
MTPQNAGYYHLAYITVIVVYVLYGASIAVRTRRTRERLDETTRAIDRT